MTNSRVDIDRLAESAYAFRDPQFDEESFEERCRKEGTNLAEQALYRIQRKCMEAITQEMSVIYSNDIAKNYVKEHANTMFNDLEKELLSWTK